MILPRKLLSLPACLIGVLACLGSSAAERVLLLRTFPTDVSWGEISVAEGPPVEVSIRKEHVAYSFSLTIACNQRERREDLNDANRQAVVTPARRRGAVYFATKLPGGREAWKSVVDKLHVRLAGLTPETFGTFAQTFQQALIGPEPALEGAFEGVMCLTVEGQSDQASEAYRKIDKDGAATGSSGFSDPRPICSKLVSALEGESPSDILASRFEVHAQREETLTVDNMQVSGAGHAAWPEGAGIEYAEAPKDATGYTSGGAGNDAVWYEELRPARGDGPSPAQKPHVLKAKTRKASIPKDGLDSDAVLTKWIWRVRDMSLGIEPKTSDHEVVELDVAFLFVAAHGRTNQDEFERSVAGEFASSDQKPGASLLRALMNKHVREVGADAMYVAYCDPTRPREASYCVASACSDALNAEEFCGALASRLESTSAR